MKRLIKILPYFLIFSTIVTVGLISRCLYINFKLLNEFTQKENAYSYAEAVGRGEPDLNTISDLFTDIVAMIGYDYKNDIISPITISYYANINDDTPVYSIEKGDTIYFKTNNRTRSGITYQGIESLPTIESGWRLAKPFAVLSKEKNDALLYVKLDELIHVTYVWIEENPKAMIYLQRIVMDRGMLPTKYNVSKYMLLFIDRTLYSEGIFLSQDLLSSVLSIATIISLFISVILLVLFLLAKHKISSETNDDKSMSKIESIFGKVSL
ncbi:MAG: hypothetical protein GX633_00420 [Clostridiales bacterium]|nr:hypothetical protein [Clostridiales bacterium]